MVVSRYSNGTNALVVQMPSGAAPTSSESCYYNLLHAQSSPPPILPLHASNDASSGGIGTQCAPALAHPRRALAPSPPPITTTPSLRTDSGPLRSLSLRPVIAADGNHDRTRELVAR
ncbi:hypothetical protein K525DRAFT_275414 [Schizophyllum commune Loenen D]|nr:hypothetical protein K525DRAFT_275414 [Schizophyllum commune Loenen D]